MNKESIIAVVLGLLLGVSVAVGAVWYTVSQQKAQNAQITQALATDDSKIQPTRIPPTIVVLPSLEVSTPTSGSIVQDKTISIEGKTGVDALVVVHSPIQSQTVRTTSDSFKFDFPLALGENVITVSSYPTGATVPVTRKLYIYRIIP